MIKAIFIDIDNTLLNFDAYVKETMKKGFAKYNIAEYEDWMYDTFHVENNKLWRQIETGELVFSELEKIRWNRVFEAIGVSFDGPVFEKFFRAELYDSAIAEPGALELLHCLSKKYILCAASNGPYEQQLHRLEIAGMAEYFDQIFISEDIGASKPSREFFKEAFDRLEDYLDEHEEALQKISDRMGDSLEEMYISPSEAMIIGDSLTSDIGGGFGYGMLTCFYNREGIDLKYLPAKNIIGVSFGTLAEIAEYFS